MLAARTAAKIVPGDQHLGIAIGRLVEHEVRVLAAVILVALLGEEPLAEAGALDGLQVLLRDDHVGVDIDDLQGGSYAFQCGELFHRSHFPVEGWDRPLIYREYRPGKRPICATLARAA